jgi:hypothetical protein
MNRLTGMLTVILNLCLISIACGTQATDNWHYPLYLSNLGYWHSQIPVVVINSSTQDVSGESVRLKIGDDMGQLHLVGAEAAGIRVVDSKGTELLWRITSPEETLITEGPIPCESEFFLPATVKAGASEIVYIYYDNSAAWSVGAILDCHYGVINSGFERGIANDPLGWRFRWPVEGREIRWCREYPHSGEHCIRIRNKIESSESDVGAYQKGIFIRGGATYHVEGWIKVREVNGKAGWRVATGDIASYEGDFAIQEIFLDGGGGSSSWKRVTAEFTTPRDANCARVSACLKGKGTAWFDDIQITCLTEDMLKVDVKPVQKTDLKEEGKNVPWLKEETWNIRVPIKLFNFKNATPDGLPVYVNMEQVFLRLHNKIDRFTPLQLGNNSLKSFFRFENALLFDSHLPAQSEQTIYAYFACGEKQNIANRQREYNRWINDKRNLVRNAGSTKIGSIKGKTGWTQSISIVPGRTYMFGGMIRCADIDVHEDISITIGFLGADGKSLKRRVGSDCITGTTDWTWLSGIFKAPDEAVTANIKLEFSGPGTLWYKGILLMEVMEGFASSLFFDQRQAAQLNSLAVWPVNPIIKVFYEDLPPQQISAAYISAARNETEPMQIALRSPSDCRNMRIEVSSPENSARQQLNQVTVNVVGYVPIDYPSNYYGTQVPYWYLKYPSEAIGSDGWTGYWPDPLLPRETFDLKANTTQPIWIEVTVPEDAVSGDYTGRIKLYKSDSLVMEIPWTVHIWNFTLPEKNTFGAVYDLRPAEHMPDPGPDQFPNDLTRNEFRDRYLSYMAEHRISSGEISPSPTVVYKDGNVTIDFSEYDKAAAYYFDELNNPFSYLPTEIFYLFTWAFPPAEKFNEKPYPGEYPYEDADRSQLRPEYKKAYQLVLKTFWNHLKERGWADRYILYLSDEPHMAENSKADIVAQMKAICDMVHEVDPAIPVYVSTWWYRPEWEGYVNIWGLGFNGEGDYDHFVTKEEMKHITQSEGRIWYTTDGHFCTETPYLALERLIPYFGYKYGAEAYEFWGVDWLTFNPYKFGWHRYIFESQAPGEESWKRYPNGDGFIIYPGKPIGQDGLVASIRLKQVREGAEDYEYLSMLGRVLNQATSADQRVKKAQKALQQAMTLVNIPCAMGRYSTKILKNPDDVLFVREQIARNIETLTNK